MCKVRGSVLSIPVVRMLTVCWIGFSRSAAYAGRFDG